MTDAAEQKKKKREEAAKARPTTSLIYIGPTLPPSLAPLPQYICFANEVPPQLEPVFKACPAIKELIVPTSDLARARVAMATAGSREHAFSAAVQHFLATPPQPPTQEE